MKLEMDGKTITRKKEIDAALCTLFGFSELSILRNVFFAEQYKAIDIIDATDSVRLQFLSSLFGFARIEKLRTMLQDGINTIDVSQVSDDVLSKLRDAAIQAEQRRDALITKQAELSSKLVSDAEKERLQKVVKSPEIGSRDAWNADAEALRNEIQEVEDALKSLPSTPTTQEDSDYAAICRHKELSKSLVEASDKLQESEGRVGLSPEAVSEFLRQLAVNKATILSKKSELESRMTLVKSGRCPITGGAPCPDLCAMTDEVTILAEVHKLQKSLEELESDEVELKATYAEASETASKVVAAKAELARIEQELRNIKINADFDSQDYLRRKENSSGVQSRRDELTSRLAEKKVRLEVMRNSMAAYDGLVEVSHDERVDASARLEACKQAETALAEISPLLSEFERAVAEQKASLVSAEEQNESAKLNLKKKNQLMSIRLALHRDNLPKLLVADMLQALNAKLDFYLSKFCFPYSVLWTAEGGLIYSDGSNDWHNVSQLSGGQKYVLVISFRCALADMLSSTFPFFVMDEPTTGLDVDNRAALSEVLQRVVEQFPNRYIVVPTHDEMLLPEANIIEIGMDR